MQPISTSSVSPLNSNLISRMAFKFPALQEGKAENTPNEQIDANKIVPPAEDICATNVGREISDEVNDEAIDEIEWADEPSLKELSGELPSTRKRMEERIAFELMKKENGELRKANAKLNGEVRVLYKEIGEKNGVEQVRVLIFKFLLHSTPLHSTPYTATAAYSNRTKEQNHARKR